MRRQRDPRRRGRSEHEAHAKDLEKYKLGTGSVQFPAGRTLSAALVRKLVKARIAENEAGADESRTKG